MQPNHPFPVSDPVIISPYNPAWPVEFRRIGGRLRQFLGPLALRIDHIGSTSVPGLAAKDIIDVQITVPDLDDPGLIPALQQAGYVLREDIRRDLYVGIDDPDSPELQKRYAREAAGQRETHIHIRQPGRLNQRYALLFRDYLRASEVTRWAYETIKFHLAEVFPESIEGYLSIKDPLMDAIFEAAQHWADRVAWQPPDDFL